MSLALRVRPEAEADISEAAVWYEDGSPGLGIEFVLAVEASLERIQSAPERFPIVRGPIRRALLRRFPYGLFYRVVDEGIEVLACIHTRRDPRRWMRRAPDA